MAGALAPQPNLSPLPSLLPSFELTPDRCTMLDLSILRTRQGAKSLTWHAPPLDGSLTIPEIFEYHSRHSPEHPLFVYPNGRQEPQYIRYPEAYRGIRKAAKLVSNHFQGVQEKLELSGGEEIPPIGILATADSITYFTLIVGIMHLGFTPFPISTRNSAAGVAHLVRATGVLQLFVSPDPAMQRLSEEAIGILAKEGVTLGLVPMPQFEDLYNESNEHEGVPLGKLSSDKVALILHSSGSTAFPKPIKLTHSNWLQCGLFIYYGDVDLCDRIVAAHTMPMFHGLGVLCIPWTACTGMIMGCFKPSSPPVLPNPESFLEAIIATRSSTIYCVPAYIEAWSRSPSNLPILQLMQAIVFGGAPLNKKIGDELWKAGVNLTPFFASTEVGCFSKFIPDPADEEEWEYFKLSRHLALKLELQDGYTDVFEPIVLTKLPYIPHAINTQINGVPAYRTSDLIQRHPTKSDYWRVYGRTDDQLMLVTGEKTNPVPLEAILLQDPYIAAALMFGRGRFQNGVIIQPKEVFEPADLSKLAEFRIKIWPTIEKVNEYAPSHSRIFKEMIIVTNPSRPFEYTPKGTPRRQVCINAYSDEINAVYAAVKHSSQTDLNAPESWMPTAILSFMRLIVERVMKDPVQDDDDLFQQGCDSLQATWIRNTILHALRSASTVSVHGIPSTFVYTNPSIQALANFVSGLFSKEPDSPSENTSLESKIQEMRRLVKKYSENLGTHGPQRTMNGHASDVGETVLLTGTTGRLGSHLLAVLLNSPNIKRVFALNREPSRTLVGLQKRQRDALQTWGLNTELLSSSKLTLLVSDLSKDMLGLQQDVYEQIRLSLTTIIHNAWKVDFNMALSSFEPLIIGVRKLIDLALTCDHPGGARLIFNSSIAVFQNHPSESPIAEIPIMDPKMSVGGGYGESKWVAEQLLTLAAQEADLRTTTVRVGQLCGDTQIGGWGVKEWVPALVAGSRLIRSLPERSEAVSWIPVDTAASVLVEMAIGTYKPVLHLVSPHPVPWNTLLKPVSRKLGVPMAPYSEWLSGLQALANVNAAPTDKADNTDRVGALSLLPFFQKADFGEHVHLDTTQAAKTARTLATMQPLDPEIVLKSVQFWAAYGLLNVPSLPAANGTES